MSHEHQQEYGRAELDDMQRAMGRAAQDDTIRQALARIDGAPAPKLDGLQAAMGGESQIRAAQNAIRSFGERS